MKFFTMVSLCIMILFLSSHCAFAGIEHIQYMIRMPDGRFDVRCTDNTREIVTVDDIRHEHVCTSKVLGCTKEGAGYYVTKFPEGERLGSPFPSSKTCMTIVQASREGLVCTKHGGRSYLTKIADGARLGTSFPSMKACLTRVQTAREGLVCTNWGGKYSLTRIVNGEHLGQARTRKECVATVQAAYDGKVCVRQGTHWVYSTRISDGKRLNQAQSYAECLASIAPKE